jgi:hypothetical protein
MHMTLSQPNKPPHCPYIQASWRCWLLINNFQFWLAGVPRRPLLLLLPPLLLLLLLLLLPRLLLLPLLLLLLSV